MAIPHAKLLPPIYLHNWFFIFVHLSTSMNRSSISLYSLSLCLLILMSSHHFFLSLTLLTLAHSLTVTHACFFVSFLSFPRLLLRQGTGFLLLFFSSKLDLMCFSVFLESFSIMSLWIWYFYAKCDIFLHIYFDRISTSFNAFSM